MPEQHACPPPRFPNRPHNRTPNKKTNTRKVNLKENSSHYMTLQSHTHTHTCAYITKRKNKTHCTEGCTSTSRAQQTYILQKQYARPLPWICWQKCVFHVHAQEYVSILTKWLHACIWTSACDNFGNRFFALIWTWECSCRQPYTSPRRTRKRRANRPTNSKRARW